jgi:hypothetical protein
VIPSRDSPATTPNTLLTPAEDETGRSNLAWLRSGRLRRGILLLGGTSLADFRIRVAQSGLRSDLSPSYWSLCGVLVDAEGTFLSVPLQPLDVSDVPETNAVQTCQLADFDDVERWPNIAVLRFTRDPEPVLRNARLVSSRRTILDLPDLVHAWLGYVWAVSGADNPLLTAQGLPSAAFVEAAHALAGVEITPGLSSAASCPEAIWQAVKRWHDYYREAADVEGGEGSEGARPVVPRGRYAVRQRFAALRGEDRPAPTDPAPRRSGRRASRAAASRAPGRATSLAPGRAAPRDSRR